MTITVTTPPPVPPPISTSISTSLRSPPSSRQSSRSNASASSAGAVSSSPSSINDRRSISSAANPNPNSTSSPRPSRSSRPSSRPSSHTPRRGPSQLRLPKIIEEDGTQRLLRVGVPNTNRCNNTLITSKYTLLTFLPLTLRTEFKKFTNMYFLIVGIITALGYNGIIFSYKQISPLGLLVPLTFFITISLLMEGLADKKRHTNDYITNTYSCIVLGTEETGGGGGGGGGAAGEGDGGGGLGGGRRSSSPKKVTATATATATSAASGDDIENNGGSSGSGNNVTGGSGDDTVDNNNKIPFKDVIIIPATTLPSSSSPSPSSSVNPTTTNTTTTTTTPITVKFNFIQRKDIRQGNLIVIRNREMIPADTVLLASSGDLGCAYIETSSIDGETNLKLRLSAKSKQHKELAILNSSNSSTKETMDDAIKRISTFTSLGYISTTATTTTISSGGATTESDVDEPQQQQQQGNNNNNNNIAVLATEAPNAHINTFTGKLTIPSSSSSAISEEEDDENDEDDEDADTIPLDGDNLLLRGAILRNTEWCIGVVAFTGTDTKLSQNSIEAPTKFSQLDHFTNKCVIVMLFIEFISIVWLATSAVISEKNQFNSLWYAGLKRNGTTSSGINIISNDVWPYLPDLAPPKWKADGDYWYQYALTFVILLAYFVPLSMIFTVQCVNAFMLYLVYVDIDMYDDTTDTCAEPRSTIVTDLGQIQYIFTDKTGTLTQNVMRFKRCSIDGMIFGTPVEKSRPKNDGDVGDVVDDDELRGGRSTFHPVQQVLAGQVHVNEDGEQLETSKGMTFDAELFLRVMSLCHTVVVEKDLDLPKTKEDEEVDNVMVQTDTDSEQHQHEQGPGGAPIGYAYQAESPDEGALVSESSKTFGFQVLSRDSTGIKLKCNHPTLFRDEQLIEGLKTGKLDPKKVAADSVSGQAPVKSSTRSGGDSNDTNSIETWSVLAINKFDSTRKRMSILLRSPPELGSAPMLLCKGADSAMLDPEICAGSKTLNSVIEDDDSVISNASDDSKWEIATTLGIQSHLGEFASEGLRTLVLGVRFLTEDQCDEWLEKYNAASSAIDNRDKKLTQAAEDIEKELHIVGATAIEDKLQVGVPDTIATLEDAGIKLWVLTGDKRETAVEIGYSTKVLTPRMHLTEFVDRGLEFVRAQCAMEFMRLVKAGKLPNYQRAVVDAKQRKTWLKNVSYFIGKVYSIFIRGIKRLTLQLSIFLRGMFGVKRMVQQQRLETIKKDQTSTKETPNDIIRRRNVRNRAEAIIKRYKAMHPVINETEPELSTDALPNVFTRARSSKHMLDLHSSNLGANTRASTLSQLATQDVFERQVKNASGDEDILSLRSFVPSKGDESTSIFDKRRRTMLERAFAADREVRKGLLVKHLKKEKRNEVLSPSTPHAIVPSGDGPRALVIEGAALAHLQGDSELEELMFNIASQCDAVIACRVTPRQKAQLVKLVRHHVVPEPVTLAIGDGANDVGMIHEAHVGIGISGKEGQQAVNASDFSIGQFRFLENLVLYHGRWDYNRMTMVILYSFFKNFCLAGTLILYNTQTLFSGTTLYDQWILSGFNFVIFFPIFFLGMFDRNLEKAYVRKNPGVYKATQQKEVIAPRVLLRWFLTVFVYVGILFYGQMHTLSQGGTSGFLGLMRNKIVIGDGQINDLQSVGTIMYTSLIFLLLFKVMYETRSIINGKWPTAILYCCNKNFNSKDGGFLSRIPYTWYGIIWGSIFFWFFCLFVYCEASKYVGAKAGTFFVMLDVAQHAFGTSSLTYLMILFIPVAGIAVDVSIKVFSNMFYPSQTQIHRELEYLELKNHSKKAKSE